MLYCRVTAGTTEAEPDQPFDSSVFLVILSITLSTLLVVCLVIIIVLVLFQRTRTKTGDVLVQRISAGGLNTVACRSVKTNKSQSLSSHNVGRVV